MDVFLVAGGRSSRLRDSLTICSLPLSGPLLLDGMGVRFAGWISWDHLCCCDPLELPVYLIVSLRASLVIPLEVISENSDRPAAPFWL